MLIPRFRRAGAALAWCPSKPSVFCKASVTTWEMPLQFSTARVFTPSAKWRRPLPARPLRRVGLRDLRQNISAMQICRERRSSRAPRITWISDRPAARACLPRRCPLAGRATTRRAPPANTISSLPHQEKTVASTVSMSTTKSSSTIGLFPKNCWASPRFPSMPRRTKLCSNITASPAG